MYAALSAFGVYFCMYAFRKPFTAAGYSGLQFLHFDYKIWLVIVQVLGYMFSKFYGIRFISSLRKEKRARTIILLILFSWGMLFLFAVVKPPYNIPFMFLNGFPLGMVWGLVFSYLEGRRTTEFMGAVLATSFIFSSGVVKSAGKYLLLDRHVTEMWMPFATGALFVLPLVVFTWMLNQYPAPTKDDVSLRSIREPMTRAERRQFITSYLPGIVLIVITYVLLTVLRDFRDNFANELWTELGYGKQASIFSDTEIPVSLIVLLFMSLLILVKSNIRAFVINHYLVAGGYMVAFAATVLFSFHLIGPVAWMIAIGTGLYLSYVPFNALYFERMIATYKIRGNVGFIMYVADSFGYMGSVVVLLLKEAVGLHLSWTRFFIDAVYIVSTVGMIGTAAACYYFRKKYFAGETVVNLSYAA